MPIADKTAALVEKISEFNQNLVAKLNDAATDETVATKAPKPTVSTSAPSGGVDGDIWFQI